MNSITLVVRTTNEPKVSYGQNNNPVANFGVAENMKSNGKDETMYWNCVAFNRNAEFIQQYVPKGTKVIIVGSVIPNNYTNKDGQIVYEKKVVVNHIEFAESKPQGAAQPQNQNQSQPVVNQQMPPMPQQMPQMPSMPQSQSGGTYMPGNVPPMPQMPSMPQMPPMPTQGFEAAGFDMNANLPFH